MTSIIAGAMLFVAMTYIGILVRNQYALRCKYLECLYSFGTFSLREITLYKTPIEKLIMKYISLKQRFSDKMLKAYLEIEDYKSYESIYGITDYIFFKKQDRQVITDFLFNMGKGDYEEEKRHIEQFIHDIDLLKINAKEALLKEAKLYSQLLALIGLALMIIVV